MISLLRRNITSLILNPHSNNVCYCKCKSKCKSKSPAYLSLYFQNLSASTESESSINHNKLSDILVHKHNFDPQFASRVASKLTLVKNPENAGLILSYLKERGFPDFRLERIVISKPRLLSASLENIIKPKINYFQEMGLSSDHISKLISSNPSILEMSLNDNIIPSVTLLKGLLGSNDEVARVIRMAPWILTRNLMNNLFPNVEFFKSCGVPMKRIRIVLSSHPSPFLLKPELMRKSAEKAKEMGIDASCPRFIDAVPIIAQMSNEAWVLKLQAFRSLGFSDSDVAIMFRKAPPVFAGSMEKIKKIKELLLETRKYTLSSIVQYPMSLKFSIEKRYIPRLQTLGILESRHLIERWPPLSKVCRLSDDDFFDKFISRYSDKVSDVCSIQKYAGTKKDETVSIYLKGPRK